MSEGVSKWAGICRVLAGIAVIGAIGKFVDAEWYWRSVRAPDGIGIGTSGVALVGFAESIGLAAIAAALACLALVHRWPDRRRGR